MPTIARALTVAGSDSGGCAGIQADLKTFAALGVHGMSALTAVTAQDTRRVHLSTELPADSVAHQIDAVVGDIGVDAVKTGMLPCVSIIEAVAERIRHHRLHLLVVDPVMVTSGGDRLMRPEATEVLIRELLPLARLVTPNCHEAEILSGHSVRSLDEMEKAARSIRESGVEAVLVKGGHLEGALSVDCLLEGDRIVYLEAPRVATRNTHGSGCTLSAAAAAFLARGCELETAVRKAKDYVTEAIRNSFPLGRGRGPLGHFFRPWSKSG